jgi:hypothetical protein
MTALSAECSEALMNSQNSHNMEALFSGTFDYRKYEPRLDNIPRILLRGWQQGSAAGVLGFNTDRGIYPWAWHYLLPEFSDTFGAEPVDIPPRLTDLCRGEVLALASMHIRGDETEVFTPFTSWTADLPTAVFFAMGTFTADGWAIHGQGEIAVVNLSPPYPITIHAPDVGFRDLPMEYLVHGPVTQGVRVVSIAAIRNALNCPLWPFCHGTRREPHPVTEEEIRDSAMFGLLFLDPADENVDVALVLAASLLSWAQVPVSSPRPLGEADRLCAERQVARPWPSEDLERILNSRLLVHNGAVPPLSDAVLANPQTSTVGAPQLKLTLGLLTRMQEAWGPARDKTAGASKPPPTRGQWEAAFRAAASQHTPVPHSCGPFTCKFCGKSRAGAPATDHSRPESIFFCSERCLSSQDREHRDERET